MKSLDEQVAIVTGASRGIGRSIAVAYAHAGARVVLCARSTDRLEALAAELRANGHETLVVTADLGDLSCVSRIAEQTLRAFGRIDILVNNAGIIQPFVDLVDMDPAEWRRIIDVNLVAPALLARVVLPAMMRARGGKIINISSIGGRQGGKGRSAYRAAKAGLINLTESLAAEVKVHGIDVNCICPGGTDTEGLHEMFGTARIPDASRLMKPEEIAALALFLAGGASSSLTGAAIDAFGNANPLFRRTP